jgi:hypothetical protein
VKTLLEHFLCQKMEEGRKRGQPKRKKSVWKEGEEEGDHSTDLAERETERPRFTFFVRPAEEDGKIYAYILLGETQTKYWATGSSLESSKDNAYKLLSGLDKPLKQDSYDICFHFLDQHRCSLTRDKYPEMKPWAPFCTDEELIKKLTRSYEL